MSDGSPPSDLLLLSNDARENCRFLKRMVREDLVAPSRVRLGIPEHHAGSNGGKISQLPARFLYDSDQFGTLEATLVGSAESRSLG